MDLGVYTHRREEEGRRNTPCTLTACLLSPSLHFLLFAVSTPSFVPRDRRKKEGKAGGNGCGGVKWKL
jgi:hypothetical protein